MQLFSSLYGMRNRPYGHKKKPNICHAKPTKEGLKQHEGHFGTDLVILNRGQVTRTTPELALPLSEIPHRPSRRTFGHEVRFSAHHYSHTRRFFSGIGFGTWSPPTPKAEILPLDHRGPES
ncbi:hypothetical protein AVEN_53506-1 [Araneus ventricosus]|uniref:Uncharacterized protein n=1 Tax=Araneus ventricosus TaxID=182803 RepID=A0A4Y2JD36_ARAVE|nr:hypothetical protein AVEN_53506-1 [Araneus ventricosus]